MPILVLHAPHAKAISDNSRTFQSILDKGVGEEYAIYASLAAQINPRCHVIVFSKDDRTQAEGTLIKLDPQCKTTNGIQTYDVHIESLQTVDYRGDDIRLNRCGVALLD